MFPELSARRIENEWEVLNLLNQWNPGRLEILSRRQNGRDVVFNLILHRTSGILHRRRAPQIIAGSHPAIIRFPRFFPCVPIEAALTQPVFHPNVHPLTGFVCLWNRFAPGDTIVEALAHLQQIIAWGALNLAADHVMQPEAIAWYQQPERTPALPLPYEPIVEAEEFRRSRLYRRRDPVKRRLDAEGEKSETMKGFAGA
jgi:hypothetical protein